MLHGLEYKPGSQTWRIAFHHFVVETADWLNLPERIRVTRIGILQIEVVRAPGFV